MYTDKEKEGGNMEYRRSQEMQKQLFVVTKNDKKIEDEGGRLSSTLTNQPLSTQNTGHRDEISIS